MGRKAYYQISPIIYATYFPSFPEIYVLYDIAGVAVDKLRSFPIDGFKKHLNLVSPRLLKLSLAWREMDIRVALGQLNSLFTFIHSDHFEIYNR